jgi:predicted secreted protein
VQRFKHVGNCVKLALSHRALRQHFQTSHWRQPAAAQLGGSFVTAYAYAASFDLTHSDMFF